MNEGDKVTLDYDDLLEDDENPKDWEGLTGTILSSIEYQPAGFLRVQPDTNRPDGEGLEWFFWPIDVMSVN